MRMECLIEITLRKNLKISEKSKNSVFLKQSIFLPLFFVILFSNVKAQENNIKADSIPWVRPAIDSVSTDKITLKNDTLHGMQDSLKVKANGIQTTIKYYAVDSIITKISTNTTHLYGDARIEYGTVNLRADQIIIDRNNHELIARGTQDSTGNGPADRFSKMRRVFLKQKKSATILCPNEPGLRELLHNNRKDTCVERSSNVTPIILLTLPKASTFPARITRRLLHIFRQIKLK